ncbi:hypothetical protein R84B8_01294 [Treponema sp. R8-4-B8]
MITYSIKLKVEGNGSIICTTERANSAAEAEQKVLERHHRLHKGKEITIIQISPPQ